MRRKYLVKSLMGCKGTCGTRRVDLLRQMHDIRKEMHDAFFYGWHIARPDPGTNDMRSRFRDGFLVFELRRRAQLIEHLQLRGHLHGAVLVDLVFVIVE